MPHQRFVKPEFFTDEDLIVLPVSDRLFAVGILTQCDKAGRCHDKPLELKCRLMPLDAFDPEAAVARIASTGFLTRYQVDGKRYLQVTNWKEHQSVHSNEAASKLPPMPELSVTCPSDGVQVTDNCPAPDDHLLSIGATSVSVSVSESGMDVEKREVVGGVGGVKTSNGEPPAAPGQAATRPKNPIKPKCRLPLGWKPTDEMIARASRQYGVSTELVLSEAADFLEYFGPEGDGATATHRDWGRTLGVWMSRTNWSKVRVKADAPRTVDVNPHHPQFQRGRWKAWQREHGLSEDVPKGGSNADS